MQVKFCLQGQDDDGKNGKLVEDLEQEIKKKIPISGTLVVHVHHGRELLAMDAAIDGNRPLSDPWVEIGLPNTQKFKTKIVNKTVNPIWAETFPSKMTITNDNYLPLKVIVFS